MENQSEFYYEKLKDSQTPYQVLLEFFAEITGKQITRSEIIMINKLLKIFGRFVLFFAIMDLSNVKNLDGNLYGILYSICSRRFEKSHQNPNIVAYQSLNKEINKLDKQIEKLSGSKIKIPLSEGLE